MKQALRALFLITIFLLPIAGNVYDATAATPTQKKQTQKKPSTASVKKKAKTQKNTKKYTAKRSANTRYNRAKTQSAPAFSENQFSALVVNASNGRILYEKNADETRYPASLTKMMTLYLTFDALKNGSLDINDSMVVSEKAASQPQTNISLNAGDRLPVKTAIASLIVRSANDSSMVLAEELGGTEWNFALMMNKKARELGMKDTVFHNPNGLPDNKQITTAYDMAKLGIALRRDFPQYYPYFKMREFSYNGITYPGHNRVMGRYPGVDGIKTGYIRASGFNLVTSVRKDGYNLVAVIMGGNTAAARDNEMINMLDRTFASLEANKPRHMASNDAAVAQPY